MPRYFFHIYDGQPDLDLEGTELADIYLAQSEAIRMSGEVMRDLGAKFWDGREWRLEVTDAEDRKFFIIHFSAEEAS
jgi:hypothetical protein